MVYNVIYLKNDVRDKSPYKHIDKYTEQTNTYLYGKWSLFLNTFKGKFEEVGWVLVIRVHTTTVTYFISCVFCFL